MGGTFFNSLSSILRISDEQAMWRVKMQDDQQAFAQLVKRWERPIQSLCSRMTGDLHRGQDLAQEAFARVFSQRKGYEPSGKFSTYLWRIALNLCYSELRKARRMRETSLPDAPGDGEWDEPAAETPAPDKSLVDRERAEVVRQALLQLPEPYRAVVVLRHYEGLKFREIGAVLDIPEGTVKSRMCEALTQLNEILCRSMNQEKSPCKRTSKPMVELLTI